MFDRVSEAAEKLATNVSRRAFLGRLGKGSLALTGAIGALLGLAGAAQAGGGKKCCYYSLPLRGASWGVCVNLGDPCPPQNGTFDGSATVSSCRLCK
jgi:hypothetical protein